MWSLWMIKSRGSLPRKVLEMNSDTWFPDRLVSDSWLSSRFSILLNCRQTHTHTHTHTYIHEFNQNTPLAKSIHKDTLNDYSSNSIHMWLCVSRDTRCRGLWLDRNAWLILLVVACTQTHTARHACGSCLSKQNLQIWGWRQDSQRKCTVLSWQPLHIIHKTSNMWANMCSLSFPSHPVHPSPYLNEHPRNGDGITHFWHFSAKSSMGAK